MNRIALLGATGSIGASCLDVVRHHKDAIEISAVSAHRSWRKLAEICQEFRPRLAILADPEIESEVDTDQFPSETEIRFGPQALEEAAQRDDVQTVVAAIVGAAGLASSYAAVTAGKRVAIANKETLVVAGPLIMAAAKEKWQRTDPGRFRTLGNLPGAASRSSRRRQPDCPHVKRRAISDDAA